MLNENKSEQLRLRVREHDNHGFDNNTSILPSTATADVKKEDQTKPQRRRTGSDVHMVYGIPILLFFSLIFLFTPPASNMDRDDSGASSKSISSLSSFSLTTETKTTIVECVVSTPNWQHDKNNNNDYENDGFDPASGTLRISIQNENIKIGSSAEAFLKLVDAKFYDQTYTFRVIKGFIVQWGVRSPSSSPTPSSFSAASNRIRKADLDDENEKESNKILSNVRGTMTMIAGGTGQVFINLGNNARLDKEGTIPFGTLDERSMMVAERIYTGYKGGSGQIDAIKKDLIPTKFPKMSRIDSCRRRE